jgi:Bacterial PH domain
MRLVPGTETVPHSIIRYLLPHERQVITVRMHPAVMIAPGLTLSGLVAAAIKLARRTDRPGVVWYASGLVGTECLRRIASWPITYFVITNERMLIIRGTLVRSVISVPLGQVESLEFQRTIGGRLLGYGSLAARSSGGRRILPKVRHLPYPEQLYLEVSGLVHPDTSRDDD